MLNGRMLLFVKLITLLSLYLFKLILNEYSKYKRHHLHWYIDTRITFFMFIVFKDIYLTQNCIHLVV